MLTQKQVSQLESNLDDKLEIVSSGDLTREFANRVALTGTAIDMSFGAIFYKTLTANTTLTFSSSIQNQTITLLISGDYSLLLPSGCKIISGEYDGTVMNYIQIHCVNISPDEYWCTISQEAV